MQLKQYMVFVVLSVLASSSVWGVTVTLTDGDSGVAMGALSNDDGDAFSVVQRGPGGVPSKPYISTRFPGGGSYAHDRRAVAEFSLAPLRGVSLDPNAVRSATLTFYFADVIWPGRSP